ncbi:hypoxanthine phosphoribosyltransferase [Marinoscillum sp. MHG1-6]|uniref:hypoxanthine phosphoribosyltransferase n=1 Tax=Marinoscillum sp. MHG1-6 TaxID=2959627 RepID=UPI0021580201|nr:hypoxanthine phosphoribosyltransferase [Marinoscillum sp. MHG1-6]
MSKRLQLGDLSFESYIGKKEIRKTVKQLAKAINKDYSGKEVILVGVLDGVVLFLADLLKKLDLEIKLELVRLKSYHGTNSTGTIEEVVGLKADLKGRHVLVVEDIIDTGQTLSVFLPKLENQRPASLEVASLLLKEEVFDKKFPVKYVGKKIENKFVVGYGMDYQGLGRQLRQIYAVSD